MAFLAFQSRAKARSSATHACTPRRAAAEDPENVLESVVVAQDLVDDLDGDDNHLPTLLVVLGARFVSMYLEKTQSHHMCITGARGSVVFVLRNS